MLESGGNEEPTADSRSLRLIALEDLPNDGFARVIRITQVQPIPNSNLPTSILNFLYELLVFGRHSERRKCARSLAFRRFGRAWSSG